MEVVSHKIATDFVPGHHPPLLQIGLGLDHATGFISSAQAKSSVQVGRGLATGRKLRQQGSKAATLERASLLDRARLISLHVLLLHNVKRNGTKRLDRMGRDGMGWEMGWASWVGLGGAG